MVTAGPSVAGWPRSPQNRLRCLPAEPSVTWPNQGCGEFLTTEKTHSLVDASAKPLPLPRSADPLGPPHRPGSGSGLARLVGTFRQECGPSVVANGLAGLSFATAACGACLVFRARQAAFPELRRSELPRLLSPQPLGCRGSQASRLPWFPGLSVAVVPRPLGCRPQIPRLLSPQIPSGAEDT
jgi:hypothetical protein